MKFPKRISWHMLPTTLIGALSVSGEPSFWQPPAEQPLNRFGVSFRAAFNIDVEFKNVGAFTALPGRLTPDGAAYNYDDGYVLMDSTRNMEGYTRYWGYDSASQVAGDGTLLMSRYSSSGATVRDDDDFCPGAEITYQRVIGGDYDWRWGLETALNYMDVSVRDSGSVSASVARRSDAYPLPPLEGGGYETPSPAPYQGRYELQPEGNPVIGATPVSSSASTVMASASGSRRFEADVFGLRFGPFLEVPLGADFYLNISGGLSVVNVHSDFEFNDAVAIVNGVSASGSGSHEDWQAGWYAAGTVSYRVNDTWELFGGAQYQDVGKYSHTENGRKAVLDLSESILGVVGVKMSF